MVSGMDFYFNNDDAAVLFKKISNAINPGSVLVFTLRYPDSISRRLVEFWLYSEAVINFYVRSKGIIQKRHGYRRSITEIREFAGKAGFDFKEMQPAMLGCECSRSRILNKVSYCCKRIDSLVLQFNCAYVFKFQKRS